MLPHQSRRSFRACSHFPFDFVGAPSIGVAENRGLDMRARAAPISTADGALGGGSGSSPARQPKELPMPKLNDTQTILLSSAAQRPEGNLYPPPATLGTDMDRIGKAVIGLIDGKYAKEEPATALSQA